MNIPCCVLVPLDFLEYVSFCVTSVVAPLVARENGLYVCISVHVLLDTRFSEFTSCVHSCVLFNSGSDWSFCGKRLFQLKIRKKQSIKPNHVLVENGQNNGGSCQPLGFHVPSSRPHFHNFGFDTVKLLLIWVCVLIYGTYRWHSVWCWLDHTM